jgi:hypothetical protein
MKTQMKNMVLASAFLQWYFDTDAIRSLGNSLLRGLKERGHASISVQELFDECGYIPKSICVDRMDGEDIDYKVEYSPSEVKLILDFNPKK